MFYHPPFIYISSLIDANVKFFLISSNTSEVFNSLHLLDFYIPDFKLLYSLALNIRNSKVTYDKLKNYTYTF